MSKIYQYFLFFLIFVSFSKNINSKTDFWTLSYSDEVIELGDSGESFLIIDLNKYPNQVIDFDDTVIIGIDLETLDSTFIAQIHKYSSKKDEEVYKIDFTSERIGKNKFKITLYDYENEQRYLLEEEVAFEIVKKGEKMEEIVPSPKNTKLVKSLSDSYGENDTISLEFSLVDTKGNDIIGNSTFVNKLKVKNDGKYVKDAKITYSQDGKIFNLTMTPQYLPLLQKINIEFNGDKDTFDLFSDDLETTIELSPFYLNTEVNCKNCDNLAFNETPSIDFKLYNYKKVPVNTKDYSNSFEIVIDGPLDNEYNESNLYSVKKKESNGNQYQMEYKEGDGFIYSGTYNVQVYEDSILIKEFNFLIEDLVPSPENTKILTPVSKSYGENDTISFEFSLADSKGNPIFGSNTFIKRLKVKNNGEYSNDATITYNKDRKTFYLTIKPKYLPLMQKINIEYNGDKDTFDLLSNDLETKIIISPFYLKTQVYCDNCENISLGETPFIDIKLYNYKDIPINSGDYSNSFKIKIEGPLDNENYESLPYNVKKTNKDENLYQIVYKENEGFIHSGTYVIKVYEDDFLIKKLEYIIYPGDYDLSKFKLEFKDKDFKPEKALVDTEFGMVLTACDSFGNKVPLSLQDNVEIYFENEKGKKIKYSTRFLENNEGELEIYITSETLGYAKLRIYVDGKEIKRINKRHLPLFIFYLMKCKTSNIFKDQLESPIIGEEITFYLQCVDKSGNIVKRGGEQFTSDNYYISNGRYTSFPIKIKDLKTGNYSFNFIPTSEGLYTISIFLDDKLFEELSFVVNKLQCKGLTPILCPNKNLCVSNRRECIEPKNNCPEKTPFLCRVNNFERCVESLTDCDCPFGFVRCDYMKYCVPMDRLDMCADFSHITQQSCKKLKQFNKLGRDGICRLSKDLSPTQKVCPIGKVLCPDLSCRDSYYDCEVSDFCKGKFRCPDQSCVDDYRECPSTISCQNKKYVCPDGTCVDSELECEALPNCPADKPFRCHDNLCVKNKFSCAKNVACGQRMALCKDLICRTNCDYV